MTQERDREDGTPRDEGEAAERPAAEAAGPEAADAIAQPAAAEPPGPVEEAPGGAPAVGGQPGGGSPALKGAVMGAVVALLLVAAVALAAPLWGPRLATVAGLAGEDRVAAVEARNNRLRDEVAQLAGRIESFEATLATLRSDLAAVREGGSRTATDDGGEVAALAQRMAKLESRVAADQRAGPEIVAALAQDTERLGRELAELRESVETLRKSAADANAVLRLSQRVESAEAAARQAAAERGSAQALLLAVGQLRETVNRGEPFAAELRAVGAILDGDDKAGGDLETLARHAAHGIPTRAQLTAAFPVLAGRIVRAGLGPDADGWWRQTVQRLASLVTIRRTDGEAAGGSTAAIVARAEGKLAAGDLAATVAELAALEGPALETAAAWMSSARARVAADRALSDLTAEAVTSTARSEG